MIKVTYKHWEATMQENEKHIKMIRTDETFEHIAYIKYSSDRGLHLYSHSCHLSDDTCEKIIDKLQRAILKNSAIAKENMQKMKKISKRKHRHCYPLFAYLDGDIYMQGTIRGNTWYNDSDTINKLL